MKVFISAIVAVCAICSFDLPEARAQATNSDRGPDVPIFLVRPGLKVTLAAQNIGQVRFLEFGKSNTLYVSQPSSGTIISLREHNGVWEKIADYTTGKPTVHGMCYFDGWLWFTQSGAVWKSRDTNDDGKADEEIKVVDGLPSGGAHWWRSILVTPTAFYTSIGDSGNATDETATDRQKIWKFSLDGKTKSLFVSGIRNTEKLRLRPGTNEIWGCDHGSDNYGQSLGETPGHQPFTDKIPPDEFNLYREGGFYGHPFIVADGLPRLEFRGRSNLVELASKAISPAWMFGAHWATCGWNFMQSDALGFQGDAIVACHGSWNSTKKVGYRIERVMFDPLTGRPTGRQKLVALLDGEDNILGRPCDVAEAPDGSILFSDDYRGRIYRISKL
jgi:glucose/arabinose dehydrogenase